MRMTYDEVLTQVLELLQREKRVAYRVLKRRFSLDDEYLEDLKADLIDAKRLVIDEEGKVLVWAGSLASSVQRPASEQVQGPRSTVQRQDPELPPVAYTPAHLAERIRAVSVTDGERKTITALFADLKGSTALIEGLDPEEARAIIDPALQLMMDAVHRYEGYVAQALGDGIFALFGAPIAHEDHPQRALYAALRMQEEMRRYADTLRTKGYPPLLMRVGVNTGEVVVRSIRKDDLHTDYVPVGHSTNLAARMEQLAAPGSILVTAYTHKLTDGYFEFKALGRTQIKGVEAPLPVYEVVGAGTLRTKLQVAVRRGLTRFVGRQSEMEQLRRALDQAKAGHGQIVGVMGEPGLGKSRLFYEFVGAYDHTPLQRHGCLVLEAYSVSHGKASPYLPVIELLKAYFQIQLPDDERRRRQKVIGKVLELDRNLEDTLPYLFALLGVEEQPSPLQQMDPQIRRRRTFEALKKLFLRESLKQPLILIFEDLHWIDSETQGFLDTFSEGVASAKVLLLVNYRPEYRHEWGQKSYYTQLRLAPFGRAEVEEFLSVLLSEYGSPLPDRERPVLSPDEGDKVRVIQDDSARRGSPDPAESADRRSVPPVARSGDRPQPSEMKNNLHALKQLILEKTEGTPFFMEEVVQELFEQGVLVRDGGETRRSASLPTDLHIPTTVQGVLAARIDRLAPEQKTLLQQLAVIGREFPLRLIRQVIPQPEDELYRLLDALQRKEFLYEQPALPDVEFIFKHALTQEVAYHSVLIERRKVLHEQTAQAIERLYADRLDEHYSDLAHHYSRSERTEKAVTYLHLAGQQAVQRSANAEAISHLTASLDLLKTLPNTPERARQELALQIALGVPLIATKGYAAPEVTKVYSRARELCQQEGETSQLFSVLWGLWLSSCLRAEYRTVRELGEQLLSLAPGMHDLAPLAHYALGGSFLFLGELAPAREQYEQGFALYDPHQHRSYGFRYGQDPGVVCLTVVAWTLYLLGYSTQALQRTHEALTLAHEVAHPFSLAWTLTWTAMSHQLRLEGQSAQERAEVALVLSTEQGFPAWLAFGTIIRGWALADQGQGEEGVAQICQGIATWQATGAECSRSYFLALLAEAHGKAGQPKEGLNVLAEALALVDKTGERFYEAELYRLCGELTLQKFQVQGSKFQVENPKSAFRNPQSEAESCFLKAIEISRRQQAKALELRAVMSLVRLRQQQAAQSTPRTTQYETRARLSEAHTMLAETYNWFTEGFDTKDLQEAKALLTDLQS
jgi:class 3 adenylate cyclase/predicted ATPase